MTDVRDDRGEPVVVEELVLTEDDGATIEAEVIEIEADIAETRDEMGGTLDEIGGRLDPANLADQARDKVREATIGRVEDAVGNAGETAKGVSNMLVDTVRRNPLPAAMAGVGLVMLWQRRNDAQPQNDDRQARLIRDARDGADAIASKAQEAANGAQQVAGDVAGTAREGAGQLAEQAGRIMNEAPFVAGIAAFAVGAAVGTLVPETGVERQVLGDRSQELVRAAGDAASELGERAEEAVASSAG